MPASEARIRAAQTNGAKSKGPVSEEGKSRSRANAYKHGLTGAGIVMPEEDAAEVQRLALEFEKEFQAETPTEIMLALRMATMSVRMQRSVDQENAALSDRVRKVMDEFVAPDGTTPEQAEKLRQEAGKIALFDSSKDACLARKYEAATERCFFRSLKDLRQLKKGSAKESAKAGGSESAAVLAQTKATMAQLGSFLPAAKQPFVSVPTPCPAPSKPASKPIPAALADWDPFGPTHFDVPIAIGKPR